MIINTLEAFLHQDDFVSVYLITSVGSGQRREVDSSITVPRSVL